MNTPHLKHRIMLKYSNEVIKDVSFSMIHIIYAIVLSMSKFDQKHIMNRESVNRRVDVPRADHWLLLLPWTTWIHTTYSYALFLTFASTNIVIIILPSFIFFVSFCMCNLLSSAFIMCDHCPHLPFSWHRLHLYFVAVACVQHLLPLHAFTVLCNCLRPLFVATVCMHYTHCHFLCTIWRTFSRWVFHSTIWRTNFVYILRLVRYCLLCHLWAFPTEMCVLLYWLAWMYYY